MAFATPAIAFALYGLCQFVLLGLAVRRVYAGYLQHHPWRWNAGRSIFVIGQVFVVLDCMRCVSHACNSPSRRIARGSDSLDPHEPPPNRVFAGGFWTDLTEDSPVPHFAGIIFPLLLVHMVLLPLMTPFVFEITAAAHAPARMRLLLGGDRQDDEPPNGGCCGCCGVHESKLRIFSYVFSGVLAIVGMINFVATTGATAETGFHYRSTMGIVTYHPANLTEAKALGFVAVPGGDILGVAVYGIFTVVMGVYIALRVRKYLPLVLAGLGLLGQVGGASNPTFFFFSSNFFEILTFASVVKADYLLLHVDGDADDEDDEKKAYDMSVIAGP